MGGQCEETGVAHGSLQSRAVPLRPPARPCCGSARGTFSRAHCSNASAAAAAAPEHRCVTCSCERCGARCEQRTKRPHTACTRGAAPPPASAREHTAGRQRSPSPAAQTCARGRASSAGWGCGEPPVAVGGADVQAVCDQLRQQRAAPALRQCLCKLRVTTSVCAREGKRRQPA